MKATNHRNITLRRIALDVVDLFHLYGTKPIGRREVARVWGIGDPDSTSLCRRWERWKAEADRAGIVQARETAEKVNDSHMRAGQTLVRLKPDARTWANAFLDAVPTNPSADTWHCWETVVDEVPGRVRCSKCGFERGRLDVPFPSCPNSSLTA